MTGMSAYLPAGLHLDLAKTQPAAVVDGNVAAVQYPSSSTQIDPGFQSGNRSHPPDQAATWAGIVGSRLLARAAVMRAQA